MIKHIMLGLSILATFAILVSLLLPCDDSADSFECTDAIGCVGIAPDEPIQIGVIQDLSGSAHKSGISQVRAIELAIAQRGDMFLGHPVKLIIEDEVCSSEGGANAATNIVTRAQVVAILGTSCSGAAATASKVMSKAGLVMVSGMNTGSSLTSAGSKQGVGWQAGYFRTSFNNSHLGRLAAEFVFEHLGLTKAVTVDAGDHYTKGFQKAFSEMFKKLGGEILQEYRINTGDTVMGPVLTGIVNSGAEIVFFPLHLVENELFIIQARQMDGLEDMVLVTEAHTESLIENVGQAGVGVYFGSSLPLTGQIIDQLKAQYLERYGEAPASLGYVRGYDATNLLLGAIEAVAIQEKDGTLHIGRQALRDKLYSTTDFPGITGLLTCDEFGDCGAYRFAIFRLDDPSAGVEGLRSNVIYSDLPDQ